jgi:hypothetical protein
MKRTIVSLLAATFALHAAHAGDSLAMLPVGSETHRHIQDQFQQLNNSDPTKGQKPSQKLSFVMPTEPPGNRVCFVMPTEPPGNGICFVMPTEPPGNGICFVMPTEPPGNGICFVMPTEPPGNGICFVMPTEPPGTNGGLT